jgi:hypothetical protein
MDDFWNQLWLIFVGLLPFLGVLGVCFVIVRLIFNADRNERKAQAEWEKSEKGRDESDRHSDGPDRLS